MRILKITGLIQEMAASEIMSYIDAGTYERIKNIDPHPLFRAYSIGHEGESEGKIVGIGYIIKKWVKGAIQMLSDKLVVGTKIFLGHVKGTNEHIGRTSIGEVVGKTIKTIKDKLHAIGIIYINKEYRDKHLDVSSIEADADFEVVQDGFKTKANAIRINEVTGIALSSSKNIFEKPGFPGATLQAQIQELVDLAEQEKITLLGGEKMTVEELKKIIQQEGITPSEIFGKSELIADSVVSDHVDKEKKRAGFSERKQANGKVSDAEKDSEKKILKLEKELGEEKNKNLKREAKDSLKTKMEDGRKLDDKQKTFIEFDFDKKFDIKDPEKWEKELDAFIDSRLEEYNKNLEILGLKKEEPESEKKDEKGIKAATKPLTITDYTDPEQNEFIPS